MIMHASRLVAAPGNAPRGRLEAARGFGIEEPAGQKPFGASRQRLIRIMAEVADVRILPGSLLGVPQAIIALHP